MSGSGSLAAVFPVILHHFERLLAADRDLLGPHRFGYLAHEIDDEPGGMDGIVKRVRKVVGDTLVYLSIDIDVLDPSIAPATGTPESGGWTTREVKRFIKGLEGVRLVGADVVEVSPPYDTSAEVTSVAASDLLVDTLALMVKDSVLATGDGTKTDTEGKDEL